MRVWFLSILTIIAIFSAGFWVYHQYEGRTLLATISPNYKPIGVIDLDYDHGVNVDDIKIGEDVVLVIDKRYPNYGKYLQQATRAGSQRFELGLDVGARDGLIDTLDPMWPYLYVVLFSNNGRSHILKSLKMVGIHGISIKHMSSKGNHVVILTDGTERTLYEYGKHIPLPSEETSVQF